MSSTMTFSQAVHRVLEEAGEPLHYREITQRALHHGWIRTDGSTPEASVNSIVAVSINKDGARSDFVRVGPGTFALRRWVDEGRISIEESPRERMRVPRYPESYDHVRVLLPIWVGVPRTAITSLMSTIMQLTGTPQETLDWSDPDTWIEERLRGEHADIARRIWEGTSKRVSPRYLRGYWYLANHYDLIEEGAGGTLVLGPRAADFIENSDGETVRWIDECEGVLHLLSLVAELGPARRAQLLEPFGDYARNHSRIRSESAIAYFFSARIKNLLNRELVERTGISYEVTDGGLAYLGLADQDDGDEQTDDYQKLRTLINEQSKRVREEIFELLRDMDPFAFEQLVKQLLEAMGYENVEVTAPTNDRGVDVVGEIELGITAVKEVIQVKRHLRNIQRPVLDMLRGSLHRFGAVRGTIITTSNYSPGTREAAFEPGAAPITLIDGRKLVDLLIDHGIGVKKRKLEVLELDPSAFQSEGTDDVLEAEGE